MITIAVDAMGGDHAPRPEVEGSVLAAREFGVRILLVGLQNVVRAELAKHAAPNLPIEIVPASDVITMQDHPAQAFRRKKDSSVHVAARLVREAKADGLVSAGNTGAVMTVAKFLLGTLESVDRVALAAPFPCSWMWAPTWIRGRSTWCNSRSWARFITARRSGASGRAWDCSRWAKK